MDDSATRSEFARALSPELSDETRADLKRRGQELEPVVWVGDRGVSENLVENFDNQLEAHELVKIRVHGGEGRRAAARELHRETGAQLVQSIGNVLLFYRPNTEESEDS